MSSLELASSYPEPSLSAGNRVDSLVDVKAALRVCAFFLILIVTFTLQLRSGAYRAELAHYSDEASHLMNGLLLRDYIRDSVHQAAALDPVEYAKAYYLNYPKIAPGMWPPLFHFILGMLLLFGGPPHATALALVGVMTAWTTWRLWRITERFAGMVVATVVAALFLWIPAVVDLTGVVMVDAAVAAVALEATYWFAEYAASGRQRHAVTFGFFAAACCLTKGNGLAVLVVPAIFIVLTGRIDLLRQRGLYYAALIVLVLAMPIVVISYRLDAAIGDFGPVTFGIARGRASMYGAFLWDQLTPILIALATIGTVMSLSPAARRSRHDQRTLPVALTALCLAVLSFHAFNPHISAALRYMMPAIAPLLALAGLGLSGITRLAASAQRRRVMQLAMLVLATLVATTVRPSAIVYPPTTWRDATNLLRSADMLAGRRVLVISDENGEGAFVSDVAISEPRPRATVVRGSKLLATDDWNGHDLRLHYSSSAALMQELEDLHIRYVVVDRGAAARRLPYAGVVSDLVTEQSGRLERVPFQDGGDIAIYRVLRQSPGEPKRLTVRVSSTGQQIAEP